MRLISLNIWGGIAYEPLLQFIKHEASSTDVFCFQEVHNAVQPGFIDYDNKHADLFRQLAELLPAHTGYHAHDHDTVYNNIRAPAGLALFIKKNLVLDLPGLVLIYEAKSQDDPNHTGALQYCRISTSSGPILIVHLQGIARPGEKLDTADRLNQSEAVVKFLASQMGRKILCGDFNLMPETKSIALIEQAGLQNLIKDYKITTTRSEINYAKYPNNIQYFADYTFVSPDVKVLDFQVPQINISDHLPMILDFE